MGCRRTAGDTEEHRDGPLLGLVAVADADLEITDEGHGCAPVRPKTGALAGFFLDLLRRAGSPKKRYDNSASPSMGSRWRPFALMPTPELTLEPAAMSAARP